MRRILAIGFLCAPGLLAQTTAPAQTSEPAAAKPFVFAVSGDSRNCGDIVMPAIAESAKREGAEFYWHLGDIRAIKNIDEDIAGRLFGVKPASLADYQAMAWDDAIENQFEIFDKMPVYIGIGNHETTPPKTREEFARQYAKWLDARSLAEQRPTDSPIKTYFHWKQAGVDFIFLDDATPDQFDSQQLTWFEEILAADRKDENTRTVIVGMHAALPDSIAAGHSMNDWRIGQESGRRVYRDLLDFRSEAKKKVYVLASHSHFYMSNVFNSKYWRSNGGVLPGWIIGTAGAHRYHLPTDTKGADEAKTNVYGYLLGTADPDGTVQFRFHQLAEKDVPSDVVKKFGSALVHECWVGNSDQPQQKPRDPNRGPRINRRPRIGGGPLGPL